LLYYGDSIKDFDLILLMSPKNHEIQVCEIQLIQMQKEIVLKRIEECKQAGERNLQNFEKLRDVDLKENNFYELISNPKLKGILSEMSEDSNKQELNNLMKDDELMKILTSLNTPKSKF
jgi:hypothetical protein